MATTTTGRVDRIFDALSESSLALTERVKAGNERAARVANAVVREVEWSQQEALSLGRQFVHHPAAVVGVTGALHDQAGRPHEAGLRAWPGADIAGRDRPDRPSPSADRGSRLTPERQLGIKVGQGRP